MTKISANYCNGSCQIFPKRDDYLKGGMVCENPR